MNPVRFQAQEHLRPVREKREILFFRRNDNAALESSMKDARAVGFLCSGHLRARATKRLTRFRQFAHSREHSGTRLHQQTANQIADTPFVREQKPMKTPNVSREAKF